jgi:predicted transcriptional regulator
MFNSPSLGPLEKEVMEVVWKKNAVSVKQVVAELTKTHSLAYTTVLTILSRLWKKGLLNREKNGKSFVYTPKRDKQQTVSSLIRSTLQVLVERYGDEAITAFIDEVNVIEKEKKSK